MPIKYQYIILDFDGTVAESGEGITKCTAWALEQMGKPVPPQSVLDRFVGPPLLHSFEEFCGLTPEEAETAVKTYRVRYGTEGIFEAHIYTGLPSLLRALKRNGAYIAVASGKPEPFLRRIIERFHLSTLIDAVAGPSFDNHSADKSAQLRAVLPEDADLSRVCMIGDRKFDIAAGKKLGVYTIGVTYGYGSKEELVQSSADEIAESVEDLRRILLPDAAPERGFMISLEGTDGCGKSTQLKLLHEELIRSGYEVVMTREPGGCPISEKIREVILDVDNAGMSAECEALLYAASRIEHTKQVLLPAIESGKTILCDRFYDSSFAYQAYGRQLGADYVRLINERTLSLIEPDCTLLFDLDRETAKSRMASGAPLDRLEREKEDFFTRVAEGYRVCIDHSPDRIHRIDSGRTIEEVFTDVKQILFDRILDEGVK